MVAEEQTYGPQDQTAMVVAGPGKHMDPTAMVAAGPWQCETVPSEGLSVGKGVVVVQMLQYLLKQGCNLGAIILLIWFGLI